MPTIFLTFSTLLPETITTYRSEWFDRRCKMLFVSGGITARSGCGAIGAKVASYSSRSANLLVYPT